MTCAIRQFFILLMVVSILPLFAVAEPKERAESRELTGVKLTDEKALHLTKSQILRGVKFDGAVASRLKTFSTQATTDVSEDRDPEGPDEAVPPVFLADIYEAKSRHISEDFANRLPYSHKLFRDHASLNTYYFFPSGYLLKYDAEKGFALNFLYRTREDDSGNNLVVMTFTIAPREIPGAIHLMNELAAEAIKPANKKSVKLQRLPISSVKVVLQSLTTMIPEENIRVINSPQTVGDEIRVQATMTESEKEDVVATIRSGGLSGDLVFATNDNSFELVVPYVVSFTDYAGEWVSDITAIKTTESLVNNSPYPLALTGIVAYTRQNKNIERHFIPLAEPALLAPNAKAKADKSYPDLLAGKGEVIATWAAFEKAACDTCLNNIEHAILVSPGMTSKTQLNIEAIPNIFTEFNLFKVVVEVKSSGFSTGADRTESKTFTLRGEETQISTAFYINRDAQKSDMLEYRIKPYHADGNPMTQSDWVKGDSTDITLTKRDIEPLLIKD